METSVETNLCRAQLAYFPGVYTGKETVRCKSSREGSSHPKSVCHIGGGTILQKRFWGDRKTEICCDTSRIENLGETFEFQKRIINALAGSPGPISSCDNFLQILKNLAFETYLSGPGAVDSGCSETDLVSAFAAGRTEEDQIKGLRAVWEILVRVPSLVRSPMKKSIEIDEILQALRSGNTGARPELNCMERFGNMVVSKVGDLADLLECSEKLKSEMKPIEYAKISGGGSLDTILGESDFLEFIVRCIFDLVKDHRDEIKRKLGVNSSAQLNIANILGHYIGWVSRGEILPDSSFIKC